MAGRKADDQDFDERDDKFVDWIRNGNDIQPDGYR